MKSLIFAALAALLVPVAAQEDLEDISGRATERWLTRAYPSVTVDAGALRRAREKWRMMPGTGASGLGAQAIVGWSSIGPESFTGTYAPGHVSGRVTAIAVHPQNINTIYIGSSEGGVWVTFDGGGSWEPLTDKEGSLQCEAIAIAPNNPNVIYAGTGSILPILTGSGKIRTDISVGVLKSVDGGATWQELQHPLIYGAAVTEIRIDPDDSSRVYVANVTGVCLSEDAGQSWAQLLPGFVTDLEMAKVGGQIRLFAAVGDLFGAADNGVYISSDDGQNWSLAPGVPMGNAVGRIEMAVNLSYPSIAYVSIAEPYDVVTKAPLMAIYKTGDGGATWNALNNIPNGSSHCWFYHVMEVHPLNADVAFFGGLNLYRTQNGGMTWSQTAGQYHVDQHRMAFPSNPYFAFLGNDGGIHRADNVAGAISWTDINSNTNTALFYSLATHPTDKDIAIGGLQDNGVAVYSGAKTWSHVVTGDGISTEIDWNNPQRMYHTIQRAILYYSNNGGGNWSVMLNKSGERSAFLTPFVLSRSNPANMYMGTYRLWKGTNSGANWGTVSGDLTKHLNDQVSFITAIADAPTDPNRIYVGTGDGKLWTTATGGSPFTDLSAQLPDQWVTTIAVHPTDPLTAYVGVGGQGTGHLFKTTNGGQTFTDVTSNLPDLIVDKVLFDPNNPKIVYVGNEMGILVNVGAYWLKYEPGLPNVAVTDIDANKTTDRLRVSTFGRGAWEKRLTRVLITDIGYGNWGGGDPETQFDLIAPEGGPPEMSWLVTPRSGYYELEGVPAGEWVLRAKASHWLSQSVPLASVVDDETVTFRLVNGDADGNNAVELPDVNLVLTRFSAADPMTDLDGDGATGLPDLNITLINFGLVGT